MKVILTNTEQDNHHILRLALDTSCSAVGIDTSEECIITTPDGFTISIIKGKKKKVSLLSTLLKKVIPYAENVFKLIKLICLLILIFLPV